MDENEKIFISYSHQDNVCAKGIARFLLKQNFDVWIDTESIITGQQWDVSIDDALKMASSQIAIISRNSVKRPEVLREISIALDRCEKEDNFRVIFVTIGKFYSSWIIGEDKATVDKLRRYLEKIQYVQLDAKGTINIASMKNILKALNKEEKYSDGIDLSKRDEYIYEAGMPEKVDSYKGNKEFYRVHSSDLAPSTAFPFALDNQWLPDEIISSTSDLRELFLKKGFEAVEVQEYLRNFQIKNLYLSLMHTRQIILNRASILNSCSLQGYYCSNNNYDESEKESFSALLQNGSIIVFLYGDNELTPYVSELPRYSVSGESIKAWNDLCKKIPMYCIRENWETPVDKHSSDFAKHCTSLAFDAETNEMLAECFGFDNDKKKDFFAILKEIEMTVFLQTHINGTGRRFSVDGYSRSSFYKNFIVVEKSEDYPEPVLNCIFDTDKPFHEELKKIIDVYYNSIFANYFNCTALIPNDIRPEDTSIYHLYLEHGIKEVGPDELEYALSEFFKNENILEKIGEIGDYFYIKSWNLERIVEYRKGLHWREYIELMEYITNRSTYWEVDFSDIEKLVEIFVISITECRGVKEPPNQRIGFEPSYTFRICIGGKVIDIICKKNKKVFKTYQGFYFKENQNSMSIHFLIGDSASSGNLVSECVFLPLKIFDGKTNYIGGDAYVKEIVNFLKEECRFEQI